MIQQGTGIQGAAAQTNLSAAEVVLLQEHYRACITSTRLLNHVVNETKDQELKQICQAMMQEHVQGIQRFSKYLPVNVSH